MNAKWVAGRIDFSRRREKLSFWAHAEAAALSVAQSDAILADAESYGWSVRETRAAVNRLKTEARLPANVTPIAGRKVFDFGALIRAGEKFGGVDTMPVSWLNAEDRRPKC